VGRYLLLTGVIRFAIEFLRVNVRVALGLTVAQYGAICLVIVGLVLLAPARGKAQTGNH
jgi:phosphatidylglycerol:prolipoprotein diacylglycerol transferase